MLTALCFVACLAVGLQSWTALRVSGFDLGIFDQAMRAYAHLGLPTSSIKNVHHEFPSSFSLLGDHFSPALALLTPLYWLWDDPRTLLVAQSALFASGVPVIRRIASHCFADADPAFGRWATDGAGLVYALGWPLLNAAYTGFHEVALAVPLTLLMLERGLARRYGAAALWALLLCAVKEDLGLVVGLFGLLLAMRAHRSGHRAGRAAGLALLVLGPVTSAYAMSWFLPAMGGTPGYYWSYGRLGDGPGPALLRVLTEPWIVPQAACTPVIKVLLLAWVVGTLALLPLGSPTMLLALPLLAERVLSDNPNHWPAINHYDAFLWPILLTASLETLGRLSRSRQRYRALPQRLAIAAAVMSLVGAAALDLGLLAHPASWTPKPDRAALVQAARYIPDGATVEADNAVAPRLTARTQVVIVDAVPRGADWVLLRTTQRAFPFSDLSEQQQRVSLLLDHGYAAVWQRDGAVLLHRVQSVPIPGMHLPGPDSTPVNDRVPADPGRSLFKR